MYSPKIQEDLVPYLYRKAKSQNLPMTRLIDRMLRPQLNGAMSTAELQFLLAGHKIILDCGHQATIGHNFANTVIIVSIGGGRIRAMCQNCGY
jgi:hypothetical protein